LILRQPTGQIVHRFIISYAGGSLAKLGTPRHLDCLSLHHQLRWGSPAKLGAPRCSYSSCKRRQLSWGLFWWSDFATSNRCAIKLLHVVRIRVHNLGQHVWGLDKSMADEIGKLSLKFFDPASSFIFSSSSRLGDYVCTRHLMMTVLFFVHWFFLAKLGTGLASEVYSFHPSSM